MGSAKTVGLVVALAAAVIAVLVMTSPVRVDGLRCGSAFSPAERFQNPNSDSMDISDNFGGSVAAIGANRACGEALGFRRMAALGVVLVGGVSAWGGVSIQRRRDRESAPASGA